jgi:hypothetical protein
MSRSNSRERHLVVPDARDGEMGGVVECVHSEKPEKGWSGQQREPVSRSGLRKKKASGAEMRKENSVSKQLFEVRLMKTSRSTRTLSRKSMR